MDILRVGAAFPNPPFNGMPDDGGLDVELMAEIAAKLTMSVDFVGYEGTDFGGIFTALAAGDYDCVASAAAVTPEREKKAAFAPPYVICGQALAVDTRRHPRITSIDDLTGLTIGVERGDTGQVTAERLVAEKKAARVRVYDHGGIGAALGDLATGGCDAVIKLGPVLNELVNPLAGVEVVQRGLSIEDIAIAVQPGDQSLLGRITVAQAELETDGTLQRLRRKWLGNPFADQRLVVR